MMNELKKGQRVVVDITGLTSRGQGVGRVDGLAVFVPTTAPQDRVDVEIVNLQKNHAFGLAHQVLIPSPHRVEQHCPAYPQCGGCTLRHISYQQELEEKKSMVEENLKRIGGLHLKAEGIIPSPKEERYRNKAQYPVAMVRGEAKLGFYAPNSHDLIPIKDCLLQPEIFGEIGQAFCDYLNENSISVYSEKKHKGLVRHLVLRSSRDDSDIMVTVVVAGDSLPYEDKLIEKLQKISGFTTLTLSHNTKKTNVILGSKETVLYGAGLITDTLGGVKLELSPHSFYQVNPLGAELLYQRVRELVAPTKEDTLLDLYCGIGSIGLSLAAQVKQLVGVEVVGAAVENATKNAQLNDLTNTRFIKGDAGKSAAQLTLEGLLPTTIIVDPPRKGLDQEAVDSILTLAPHKIVYVSCNSATLARDAKKFVENGYTASGLTAVDLFPRTAHVEAVLLFTKE